MISGNAKSKTHLVIVTVQLPATKIFVCGTVCGAIGRDIPVSSVLMFLSSVQNQNKDQWQKKTLTFFNYLFGILRELCVSGFKMVMHDFQQQE